MNTLAFHLQLVDKRVEDEHGDRMQLHALSDEFSAVS